jgi:pilus assembly protein CpaB
VSSATPDAITDIAGSIARSEILAGEPIRAEKLVPAGGGFLSSILETGMRAVSVSVAADSASGGFVSPGDRVDVVLTRTLVSGQDSQIILRNVRVLAINAQLGDTAAAPDDAPASAAFANTAIATLELDPTEAQVIINATSIGKLTLMLRPVADAPASERADTAANAAIRLSSPFWTK